jgi:hypothetical protein
MNGLNFDLTKIKIEEIRVVDASISNPKGVNVLHDDEELILDLTFETGVNIKNNRIKANLKCDLKPSKSTDIAGSFNLSFIYHVENLSDLVIMEDNLVKEIDSKLLECLSDTTYSTSRGIIYSRCLGTIFKNVILPMTPSNTLVINMKN